MSVPPRFWQKFFPVIYLQNVIKYYTFLKTSSERGTPTVRRPQRSTVIPFLEILRIPLMFLDSLLAVPDNHRLEVRFACSLHSILDR